MHKFYLLLLLFGFNFHLEGQVIQFDSIGVKSMEIGTVVIKGDTWVIKVNKPGFDQFYIPVNLPEKFCLNNQEVVFEGAIGRVVNNQKIQGTPLKISMIRVLYRTKPDPEGGEVLVEEKQNLPKSDPDSVGYISKATGKIMVINEVYLIEQENNGEIHRYVPDFLPEDFKVANTIITFSATILKIDPNIRMMGTPIKLKEIMAETTEQFDEQKMQEAVKSLFPFDSVGHLPETKGIIRVIADTYIIEVVNGSNDINRYLPVLLPDDFKQEGLAVIVSGTIGKIPANVRMVGTPLTLVTIGKQQ